MENLYRVKKWQSEKEIYVEVPGSKSITNRALLLAALSNRQCLLKGVLFSDDSRAFLDSLQKLGFEVQINEAEKTVALQGTGGRIPNPQAVINVRSAGTAARFLTVMLAFAGGEYEMEASEQMCKRPMQPLLTILKKAGVIFEFRGETDHFPFRMKAEKAALQEVAVDTGVSSQFASALLMAGILLPGGFKLTMEGDRAEGAYIKMTLAMMKQFGIHVKKEGNTCTVMTVEAFGPEEYEIEPDVSGACYFYAMAPLFKTSVIVKGVHRNSLQGDIKFLEALERMGCKSEDTKEGIQVSAKHLKEFTGLTLSMKDFSDQTMTMAAVAPFAKTPTLIQHIGHIRFQESDRIHAILTELTRIGIRCEEVPKEDGIRIYPIEKKNGYKSSEQDEVLVETYEDHRMAMAFTLIGLRTGNIVIKNPGCCRKTFENYFELIDELTENK